MYFKFLIIKGNFYNLVNVLIKKLLDNFNNVDNIFISIFFNYFF